jgi:CHAT domain-containing protein/Tfp pilus assembly protein PilF
MVSIRLAAFFALATTAIALGRQGAPAPPLRDLEIGRTYESDFGGATPHRYRLPLSAGDFVRVVVEQRGLDVMLRLLRPDGSVLISVDTMNDAFMAEPLVVASDVSGVCVLDVRAVHPEHPAGKYAIRLEAARPMQPGDAEAIEAERLFERGRAIEARGVFSEYANGADAFLAARDAFAKIGDQAGTLKSLWAAAALEFVTTRPEMLELAKAAEALAAQLHDDVSRAKAVHLRGLAFQRAGDLTSALLAYEEALAIYRRLGHRTGETGLLGDIGLIHGRTGDSDRALVYFERALALGRELRLETQWPVLNNIGIAFKNVGEYDKALEAYQQVLNSPIAARDRIVRATVLNNAGNLERLLGRPREALALHQQSLALARAIGNRETEARALNTIGQTHFALGEYDKALQFEEQSLALRRTSADLPGQAASLDAMGRSLAKLGNLERAYESLTESLAIRRRIRETYTQPDVLRELARLDRTQDRLPLALERIKEAVDLDEMLRERITSPELRTTFVASELDTYELYIDLLQQQAAVDPGGGHAAAALQVSERARARVLLESLLDARVDLRQGIDPALLARERALQKQLSAASAQLSRASAEKGRSEPPAELIETYERLTAEYSQHLALIRQQSPHYAAVTQPQPLDLSGIRQVIGDGTVLLEFELGDEKSWLWAVTQDSLATVPLPSRREIDAAARALYETLTARQRRPDDTAPAYTTRVSAADAQLDARASAVSQMLLGGIAAKLRTDFRGKRLAIVAAGSLEYVPFAALPIPTPGSRESLGSRHEIVKIPSASVLAVLRSEEAGRPDAPRPLAIVADPVFDPADPRVSNGPRPAAPPGDADALRAHAVDESIYVRSGFSRLPFSREEGRAIAAIAGGRGVFTAMDFDATRETALGGGLSGYRIVHLATHGVLNADRPSLSGLVFSLVDVQGRRQDGFVRLHDIYNMRLDADLVVLSACQTALGKNIRGEGLIGLTRGFMYAGAPRVVASLWEVSDLATAELMKKFYTAMLQRHLSPAAALRAAQLEMARDPRWSAPYYWAGFVFQGDWR